MTGPDPHGWWSLEVDHAGVGTDYGFLIDDDPTPYPDPRSMHQPSGVHGLSRVVDHSLFQWSDPAFQPRPLSGAVLYELHIGTFTPEGTLDSAIGKLDHLVHLGITHVELMPVAAFAGDYGWGYDGVALFAVHEPYGGPDALKRFVDAAHAKGLAVLLDVVYNHFGPSGNYSGKFGPYATESHRTPWGGAVNLEESGAYEVRRFFIDNALMWLRDFHIDGLRLDAVHAFVDRSAIHFLEQLSIEVETLGAALGRIFALIAESDLNDPRLVAPRPSGGFGLTAQWSDDFHHALVSVLDPSLRYGYYSDFGSIGQLAKAIQDIYVYDGIYSEYRGRVHGRPAGAPTRHKFLGYSQNHDQVGNQATGSRLHQSVGLDRAKIAAALVLTAPFVPLLFQGEEWAAGSPFQYFAQHDDPELAQAVSRGRKNEFRAFGWDPASIPDPESRSTFERSKLNWSGLDRDLHREMLAWYRSLIQLRRETPELNDGEAGHARVEYSEADRWLKMARDEVLVLVNLGSGTHSFNVLPEKRLLLSSRSGIALNGSGIDLPPDSVAILAKAG